MSVTSLATTPTFQFTLAGHIESNAGSPHLVCLDGTRLRVVPAVPECSTVKRWQVIPSTDSTTLISNVSVVDSELLCKSNLSQQDQCQFTGRVVELGKRQQQVLFKVARPGEKTLKLTLLNPDSRMRVGELWSCTAVRVGATLEIVNAALLEKHQDRTTEGRVVLPNPVSPDSLAFEALVQQTGNNQWELAEARQRAFGWEWEAVVPATGERGRVQIYTQGQKVRVYQYHNPALKEATS